MWSLANAARQEQETLSPEAFEFRKGSWRHARTGGRNPQPLGDRNEICERPRRHLRHDPGAVHRLRSIQGGRRCKECPSVHPDGLPAHRPLESAGAFGYSRLFGDAQDSPIVDDVCDPNQFLVGLGAAYRFDGGGWPCAHRRLRALDNRALSRGPHQERHLSASASLARRMALCCDGGGGTGPGG
jgi:hypothetical protein